MSTEQAALERIILQTMDEILKDINCEHCYWEWKEEVNLVCRGQQAYTSKKKCEECRRKKKWN